MTIKVEQETLLRALERQPSRSAFDKPASSQDGFIIVDFRKPLHSREDALVERAAERSMCDDEDSVFTLSTASLSDTDSELERRVSFADDLVTEEWTRPATPKEEIPRLFYTTEETQR